MFQDVLLLGTLHVNTLLATMTEPIKERVEGIQTVALKMAATGVVNTGTGLLRNRRTGIMARMVHTGPPKSDLRNEAWADVVRRIKVH